MADNGLTPTETVGLIAAVHAVARVIEGGFKAMIGFFKKKQAADDERARDAKQDATAMLRDEVTALRAQLAAISETAAAEQRLRAKGASDEDIAALKRRA